MVKVGKPAPDFKLPSTKVDADNVALGKELSLADYRGKWLVLFFYPKDFSIICPTEIVAFSDRYHEFERLSAEVLGCSVDPIKSHWTWLASPRERNGIAGVKYPLASDTTKVASRAYDVLDDSGLSQRALFIIDPKGILKFATVTDNNIGRSVDETLRILQALQSGGLCAANWKPGIAVLMPA
jgi:peroxiredoxin (alkyl hydroperoxide reductase subunit C)